MPDKPLDKLIAAARKAKPPAPVGPVEPPYGFATRVAAEWSATRPDRMAMWDRLAWRGFVCAALVCMGTALIHQREQAETALVQLPSEGDSADFF